jgi:hypothetical protein
MGMADAGGSTVAGAPQAANPLSIGLGNFQNSSLGQTLGRGADAMQNFQKFQTAQGLMGGGNRPAPAPAVRPPSMNQQPQQTPFAQQFGSRGAMGNQDSAKLAILKRLGLLGGM